MFLRKKAKSIEPALRIGKSGLSESVIKEIKKLLIKRKLIKVRLLPASVKGGKKSLIEEISLKTKSEIIESAGNVVVLYRE